MDGFDEVAETEELRQQVMNVVQDLVRKYHKCHFLLTSRAYAWEQQSGQLLGFAEVRLAPFSKEQIEIFIDHLYEEFKPLRPREMTPKKAKERAARLKQAILYSPTLSTLGSRPLLLTLMTILHVLQNCDLPQKRQRVYEKSLTLLLYTWETRKVGRDVHAIESVILPATQEWLKVEPSQLLNTLAWISYEAHAGQLLLEQTAKRPGTTEQEALWKIGEGLDLDPAQITSILLGR